MHGYPIKAPMLDIHTVGAGGGSIAFVDSGGLLKVGPRSAGADPGPVCYGRGASEPTVTDANVVLGLLNPRIPAGRPDGGAARSGAGGRSAVWRTTLGLGAMETAQGIISVVTANMARAIRVISVQRGYDPRDYTLVAFGGAGPVHAARLARELEISRVLVPVSPGILCAMGLLLTDLRTDFALTRLTMLDSAAWSSAGGCLRHAGAAGRGVVRGRRRSRREPADRAHGGHAIRRPELRTCRSPCRGGTWLGRHGALAEAFAAAHRRLYGFTADDEPVQLVTFRVEASAIVPKATFHPGARCRSRRIRRADRPPLRLVAGSRRCGRHARSTTARSCAPAIAWPVRRSSEQMDATTLSCPAWTARVEPYRQPDPGGRAMIDPITVEVIGSALSSIVEEMGEALIRASYSTNIKERRDCSTALFDLQGRTLCQAEHIPMHLGSFLDLIPHIMKRHPMEQMRPGDVFVGNDAYEGGGTHLPDIVLAEPVFVDGADDRLGSQPGAPCRFRRSRPRAYLSGRAAHPAYTFVSRRRAAAGRAWT